MVRHTCNEAVTGLVDGSFVFSLWFCNWARSSKTYPSLVNAASFTCRGLNFDWLKMCNIYWRSHMGSLNDILTIFTTLIVVMERQNNQQIPNTVEGGSESAAHFQCVKQQTKATQTSVTSEGVVRYSPLPPVKSKPPRYDRWKGDCYSSTPRQKACVFYKFGPITL